MSVTRHHADWLSLVEVSGPFVSLPVLQRVFSGGLDKRDPAKAKALRAAYEEWQDNPTAPGKQRAWVMHVLTSVLSYPENQIAEGQALPAGLEANMPEMGETLRPDFVLVAPAGSALAGQPQLLITSYMAEQSLEKPVSAKQWKATPATRMMELLHGANVPLGLVTNGEHWMLVYAPRGETTGYASWYGSLWLDEPITLRAFHSLLDAGRFFNVAADSTLLALLKESANDQQEVTDQLGYQVREAVEVLVQSFDALDKDSNRTLLKGIKPANLYDSALTVMMRLVFLFSAEERGLLHLGKPLYDDNYAVSTLQEQLQEVADRYGEEVLERRFDAWARLLATFRAVHSGIRHQDLLMQAYGGSLFDPDRYPFLEGRAAGSQWRSSPAEPLSVNNRVVLHLLNSLQRLRTKVGAGTTAETRRVSFRALGVEQIGHVYEGLLDHTAFRADEVVLGIRGPRSKKPEIALTTLESLLEQGEDKLIERLKADTGRSVSALRRELNDGSLLDEHKLIIACDQNEALLNRLRPFAGLIREDSFDRPWVVLPGSIYVTGGTARRSTGTHYTPPSLTEPIVQRTLEPLVYVGPAEGLPKEQWKLKSPKDILDLKVCDMAMGSGAFLVQACRYLAECLVEAWENEEKAHPDHVLIAPDGKFSEGSPSERLVPVEAAERIAIARRVVADRCLYGVDINPMAVEMAKLSMWLITVDAKRPFTFLDHAFKCGDSLLGITSLEQLENFSLRPDAGKLQGFNAPGFTQQIKEAKKRRKLLETILSDTPEQIAAKAALYAEAEEAVAKLSAVADVMVALELKGLKGKAYETEREATADQMMANWAQGLAELQQFARQSLGARHCFHWSLTFPEIMESGGFHAFVGNPPFVASRNFQENFGEDYTRLLITHHPGSGGQADICAYFFRQAWQLRKKEGTIGLLATNTISEGDTRAAALDFILQSGGKIYSANKSFPWPGGASLYVSSVHCCADDLKILAYLNGCEVQGIDATLSDAGVVLKPFNLQANIGRTFKGTGLGADWFIFDEEDASRLLQNRGDNEVLKPYLTGQGLVTNHKIIPDNYCVDFPDIEEGDLESRYRPIWNAVKRRVIESTGGGIVARWWRHRRSAGNLYNAIARQGLAEVIVKAQTGKAWAFAITPTTWLFDQSVIVFLPFIQGQYAVLQSELHCAWVERYSSTHETRLRYSPSDVFENFPFPEGGNELEFVGHRYYQKRSELMSSRRRGLTATYNEIQDASSLDSEVVQLRKLQEDLDIAVAKAYGWQDLDLGHGFHETKQGIRFTISEAARREVLDRLLALNHQRHAKEVAAAATQASATPTKRGRKKKDTGGQATMDF